jgi:hypothetical protein
MQVLAEPILGYEVVYTSCDDYCNVCNRLIYDAAERGLESDAERILLSVNITKDSGSMKHEIMAHRLYRFTTNNNEPF